MPKAKKEKTQQLGKLIDNSESENDETEHELSHYMKDRVQLMKQVLKIIKPKRIKTMAPDCMKDMEIGEINSLLLEELLGISNKRLKYIFNGQNVEEDSSSSTDPEEDKDNQVIDIISLDDVSDDDFSIIDVNSGKSVKKKKSAQQDQPSKTKKIKKEKDKDGKSKDKSESLQEDNLMNVLELLELQARARAIRSQLLIEGTKKSQKEIEKEIKNNKEGDSDSVICPEDDDDVIIQSPKKDEIVITSSDSENETEAPSGDCVEKTQHTKEIDQTILDLIGKSNGDKETELRTKKIQLVRDRNDKSKDSGDGTDKSSSSVVVILANTLIASPEVSDKPSGECSQREGSSKGNNEKNDSVTPEDGEICEEDDNMENEDTSACKDDSSVSKNPDSVEVEKVEDKNLPIKSKIMETSLHMDDDDDVILIVDQDEIDGMID